MARTRRLQDRAAFAAVFENGCKTHDACFTVYAAPNRLPYARVGLTVSRKTARAAVRRNRIRRHVRESFRREPGLAGLDVVVVARSPAAEAAAERLRASLAQHWKRITKCRPS